VAVDRIGLLRLEIALATAFFITWSVALLGLWRVLPLAGLLELDLYRLYSVAAVLGWLSGNIYVLRRRFLPSKMGRRRSLIVYFLGPVSLVYILRSLASLDLQQAAPLVPLLSLMVYGLFFLVPVTLQATRQPLR
jgi:hypothetical protein